MTTPRKIYLQALITEAVRVLKEANFPPPPAPSAVPPSPAPVAPETNASAQTPPAPNPNASPAPAAPGTDPAKPFDVDAMIDRLNVIRGGKSFSDPEVYGQLTAYFKTLSEADKGIIDRFLQSIGKTVIQVDSNQVGTGGGAQPAMNQAPPVAVAPAPSGPVGV